MTKQANARRDRNVVPFPARASSGDKAGRAKRTNIALIRECVVFAQSIAAYEAGFKADPDGNNAHAAALGNHHLARARQALVKLSHTPATTAEGLQAKARIVSVVIDEAHQSIERHEEAFLLSFAADVKAFLGPTINEHWRADLAAKQGEVAS
jgi:hypothetical protein